MASDLDDLSESCLAFCQAKGWDRGWSNGGCYLHLEASEFIESLRGKGNNTPEEEAGDVLFVLLSILASHNLKPSAAVTALNLKLNGTKGLVGGKWVKS